MTAKEVVNAMAQGAILCMEFAGSERVYWLEPKRKLIRSDVAERVIGLPGISPGGDSLFKDAVSQTWGAAA